MKPVRNLSRSIRKLPKMSPPWSAPSHWRFCAVIIVTVLYMGREIFVPVALAILLSFVLAPPVAFPAAHVECRAPLRWSAVVLFAFAIIFALGSLIATQLNPVSRRSSLDIKRLSKAKSSRSAASREAVPRSSGPPACCRIWARNSTSRNQGLRPMRRIAVPAQSGRIRNPSRRCRWKFASRIRAPWRICDR